MKRITFELGLRGREEDVAEFVSQMKDKDGYYSGRAYQSTDRSFQRWYWDDSEDITEPRIIGWVRYWSTLFPESEAYYTITEEHRHRPHGDLEEVIYGLYRKGDNEVRKHITTHAEYVETFDQESRPCSCGGEGGRARRSASNPLRSPFLDCPPRLDPPRAWVIENIMEASDMIGRR